MRQRHLHSSHQRSPVRLLVVDLSNIGAAGTRIATLLSPNTTLALNNLIDAKAVHDNLTIRDA